MARLLVLRFPAIVLFLSTFVSCAPLAPVPSRETRPPGGSGARRRAVLISFDAVSGERLARLLEDPAKLTAGGYRRIAERGFFAVRSVPPTPSLTAVSHITHVTGALPQATGIVSNWMLDWSKPFGTALSGFDAPVRAETLWEAARRQGKRTGVMLYPGADGKSPERTADWAMIWPGDEPLARARLHLVQASSWEAPEGKPPGSFSPARRLTIAFSKTPHSVTFFALDATDDGKVNYDRLRVVPETGPPLEVRPDGWFPVELKRPEGRTGAWCKLLVLAPDLSKAEIYMGGLYRNAGYPEEFVKTLDERIGFWPGTPDSAVFGAGSTRSEVFLEQAERVAGFLTQAQLLAFSRNDWDLLLMYQPQVDEVSHEFWLTDPRQSGYAPDRAARFAEIVDRGYALADRSLDAIEKGLAPGDSIFVTSDHGMTAIWREIFPNEILRQAGVVVVNAEKRIDPSSAAVAITSGGIAHIYLKGSSESGLLEKIERLFRDFRVRGESPWERLVRREDAGSLGLNAPESGDLILLAKPGYVLARGAREGETLGTPDHLGAHGYLNVHPQLHATFLAAGPGISRARVPQINSWEIAARVAKTIEMKPPRDAARP